jgi:hypothetical protein
MKPKINDLLFIFIIVIIFGAWTILQNTYYSYILKINYLRLNLSQYRENDIVDKHDIYNSYVYGIDDDVCQLRYSKNYFFVGLLMLSIGIFLSAFHIMNNLKKKYNISTQIPKETKTNNDIFTQEKYSDCVIIDIPSNISWTHLELENQDLENQDV